MIVYIIATICIVGFFIYAWSKGREESENIEATVDRELSD